MVYKLSDVKLKNPIKNNNNNKNVEHCASEKLRRKLLSNNLTLLDNDKKNSKYQKQPQKSDLYNYYKVLLSDSSRRSKQFKRRKRWLNDEVRKYFLFINFIKNVCCSYYGFCNFVMFYHIER